MEKAFQDEADDKVRPIRCIHSPISLVDKHRINTYAWGLDRVLHHGLSSHVSYG